MFLISISMFFTSINVLCWPVTSWLPQFSSTCFGSIPNCIPYGAGFCQVCHLCHGSDCYTCSFVGYLCYTLYYCLHFWHSLILSFSLLQNTCLYILICMKSALMQLVFQFWSHVMLLALLKIILCSLESFFIVYLCLWFISWILVTCVHLFIYIWHVEGVSIYL